MKSNNGLLTTIAANPEDKCAICVEAHFHRGRCTTAQDGGTFRKSPFSERMAMSVKDTAGVYLVPHYRLWSAALILCRGCIGSPEDGQNHFVRAGLESIAYQTHDVVQAMEADAGCSLNSLKVDGGASQNNFLMQFQADIVNTKIERPKIVENTALGAAYLAGLTVGFWKDQEELKTRQKTVRTFEPKMQETERQEKLEGWNRAVSTAKFWSKQQPG